MIVHRFSILSRGAPMSASFVVSEEENYAGSKYFPFFNAPLTQNKFMRGKIDLKD
jgi:hypothetical protein